MESKKIVKCQGVCSRTFASALSSRLFARYRPWVRRIAKDKHPVIERFQATAMDLDSGRATIIDIGVFAWSSDADRQALIRPSTTVATRPSTST